MQRSRWTDERIDDLAGRVVTLEDTVAALSRMPAEVRDLIIRGQRDTHAELIDQRREMLSTLREQRQEMRELVAGLPRPLGYFGMTAAILTALIVAASPFFVYLLNQ